MPEGKIMPRGYALRNSEAYAKKHMPGARLENALFRAFFPLI